MTDHISKGGAARPAARRHHHSRAARGSGCPVLYIHPAKQGPGFRAEASLGRSYGLFPVGLPALVNRLRENGIAVQGAVHPLEMQLDPTFRLEDWLRARADARIILIDLHWYEHCFGAVETAQLCKRVLPRAWTVLGGLSASGFAREILAAFPAVDFIIRGDAEKPLLDLARLLLTGQTPRPEALAEIANLSYRAGGTVVENDLGYCAAAEDLDSLNFADIDFIDHYREYYVHEYIVTNLAQARAMLQTSPYTGRWITTARGCKYECSYCGGCKSAHKHLAGRTGLVVRSPVKVAEELARLQQNGVIQASLSYDIAEISPTYGQELFAAMRDKGVRIGLYNEFFQLPTAEFVREFAAHGEPEHTCAALSPLAGSERVRRMNGKHFSNDAFFDILDALAQQRMYLFVYFSMNLPGETRETFQQTLDFARDIYDFYPHSLLKILNTVHTIDPLSPMNVQAGKYGLKSNMSSFMDYYRYCRDTGQADPASRSGLHRGFEMTGRSQADLEAMVQAWDQARLGRESCWWPVPPGW